MNVGDEAERLPSAIGELVDLALRSYGRGFGFAALLSLGVFALSVIVDVLLPRQMDYQVRGLIDLLVELIGTSFVIGFVALGVAAHVAGTPLEARTLLRAAAYRWPAVFGASILATALVLLTANSGGIGPIDDPTLLIGAPVAWLLWGAVGLAAPIAALSSDTPVLAAFSGFGRALMISLRIANVSRLAVVAFATIVPIMLESMLGTEFTRRDFARADFWASLPIDCIVVGPLAALQTVFALDFARRAAAIERPRP